MMKVIKFIIEHGDVMLDKMRAAAGAEASTPYLFEGNEGYESFMTKLEAEKKKEGEDTELLSATGLGDESASEEEESVHVDAMEIEDQSKLVSKPTSVKKKSGRGKALPRKN